MRPLKAPNVTLTAAAGQIPGSRLVHGEAIIRGLTLASGQVEPGDLFAALPGATTHGARHARAALAAGAAGVLTDPVGETLLPPGTPRIVTGSPRQHLGELAAWIYGHPARRLKIAGVTGTNGKTTAGHLLESALAQHFGKVALLGTIVSRIDGEQIGSVRTTAEAPELQATLAAMVERGVEACVMEVSSHGLALGRVDGLTFDVVAFTNLSRDHLDFHHSMGRYFAAKASLFTPPRARLGVINLADPWAEALAEQATIQLTTVSRDPAARPDWLIEHEFPDPVGSSFDLSGPDGQTLAARVRLPGGFNVDNAALALTSAMAMGVSSGVAAHGVAIARPVPGRMEPVLGPPSGPTVVVDYAHAPSSVAAALAALRPHTKGRLIVVLGAGGDRDQGKRELMGAAAKAADVIFVTDDNPRREDPTQIRAAVARGAGPGAIEVPDRADAISRAVMLAGQQDTVVILGKGHERSIDYDGELRPHQDSAVAAMVLRSRAEGVR